MTNQDLGAPFQRVTAPRTSEVAAQQIADLVMRGVLTEGARLPSEPELARLLGISRASVREALRLLESWGLVEVHRGRGRGTQVRRPGVEEMTRGVARVLASRGTTLEEITHARIAIEGACIRLAVARYDRPFLETLWASAQEVQPGTPAWQEHTVAFHTALGTATGNSVLETVVASLGGLIRFSASLTALDPEAQAGTLLAHRRIAEALLARDAPRAERRLVRHMMAFLDAVRAHPLKVSGPGGP